MKKTIAVLLALIAVLALLASCGKKEETELDPNAVLTDSDVPLDVGADIGILETSEAASPQM